MKYEERARRCRVARYYDMTVNSS